MDKEIKQILAEELLDKKTKVNKKRAPKEEVLSDSGEEDFLDNTRMSKAKLVVWAFALLLIILQVIFLGWWTILTGLVTGVIAYYVADVLVNTKKYWELIGEYRIVAVVWILAVVLIIVQILALGWWTILTAPFTIALAFFLPRWIRGISNYFRS